MKRDFFKTLCEKRELNKVYTAIALYNKTFSDEIIIEDIKDDDELGTWLTLSYSDSQALFWFGIYLGRQGL